MTTRNNFQFTRNRNGGNQSQQGNLAQGSGNSGQAQLIRSLPRAPGGGEQKGGKKLTADFLTSPFKGEPVRVPELIKLILLEASTLTVTQDTEEGEIQYPGNRCFTEANFYFIDPVVPIQIVHVQGEDEQARRDKDAEITNWKLSTARLTARNASHKAFWDHFSLEATGWLRKRIAPDYWTSLQTVLGLLNPFVIFQELKRVGSIAGEVNSTIADNQRLQKLLQPWDGQTTQAHEFHSRFMQSARDDQAITLPNGVIVDPLDNENWTLLEQELADRFFYRLITQHKAFVSFRLPQRYDEAIAKFMSSPVEHTTYSAKVQAIIKECAKLDTQGQIWDNAPKAQQPLRQSGFVQQSPPPSAAASGAQQTAISRPPGMTPSIKRLVRDTYQLTNRDLLAVSPDQQQVLMVGAIRSQLASPNLGSTVATAAAGSTRCNCGVSAQMTDCRSCLLSLLGSAVPAGMQPAHPSYTPQRVAAAMTAASASNGGLSPALQHIAQTAAARAASNAAAPAGSFVRKDNRKVQMIRAVRCADAGNSNVLRMRDVTDKESNATAEQRLLHHPSFVVDSGSEITGICPEDMLRWAEFTQREFPVGYMQGESCSGERLTILGEGTTLSRWPSTTAILELQDRVLSVKEFTGPAMDQDVFFPARSRGLPFGVVFADAKTGLVTDVGDQDYKVQPEHAPHHQRGQPWRLAVDLRSEPVQKAVVNRLDAAEMVRQEAGLTIVDSLDEAFDEGDQVYGDDDGGNDWYSLPASEDADYTGAEAIDFN